MNKIEIKPLMITITANLYESEHIECPVFILCHQVRLAVASILKRLHIF